MTNINTITITAGYNGMFIKNSKKNPKTTTTLLKLWKTMKLFRPNRLVLGCKYAFRWCKFGHFNLEVCGDSLTFWSLDFRLWGFLPKKPEKSKCRPHKETQLSAQLLNHWIQSGMDHKDNVKVTMIQPVRTK